MGIPTTLDLDDSAFPSNRQSCVGGMMQKSKSSSSVVQHGRSLVSKKIWRSRSKSQARTSEIHTGVSQGTSVWTPQGGNVWSNASDGRLVRLSDAHLLELTSLEQKLLQGVSLAKIAAMNGGNRLDVKLPSSEGSNAVTHKPKRRTYLLKRKALTTGFFDNRGKDDKDKCGGLVFGIPLCQVIDNDRAARDSRNQSPLRVEVEGGSLRRQSHHGSRSSFTSLNETTRADESGSCESLVSPTERLSYEACSIPGLLDNLSCSTLDISCSERESVIPHFVLASIRHLETYGLHTEGLFRVCGLKTKIRHLREDIDCGKEGITEDTCPHVVSSLLKEFFRDLPDPLLCRELYHAFVHTQSIRHRRFQLDALQYLIHLLPVPNRDTLYALINFLANVALHSTNSTSSSGECIYGNKMDTNNLATVIAPNILHNIKPGNSEELRKESAAENADVINVVRSLIDHHNELFIVSAELLDEVYVHMMDSHPDALDSLLRKKETVGEDVEDVIEGSKIGESRTDKFDQDTVESVPRVWSREDFLDPRCTDRGRERRRLQDLNTSGPTEKTRSVSVDCGSVISSEELPGKLYKVMDDQESHRSSSIVGDNSCVITASLKIPVPGTSNNSQSFALNLDDADIPFIEDATGYVTEGSRQQLTIGLVRRSPTSVQSRTRSASSSDSLVQGPETSVCSSSSSGCDGTPSGTPSWAFTPPTSPDAAIKTVNYIPEPVLRPELHKAGDPREELTARFSIPTKVGTSITTMEVAPVLLQKVTFTSTSEIQQIQKATSYQKGFSGELPKSASTSATLINKKIELEPPVEREVSERKLTASISSIGGAVMRSKTADIERMLKLQKDDKKNYAKRRYTDSRHQTRHIPDADTLQSSTKTDSASAVTNESVPRAIRQKGPGLVWKRRELIASDPKEHETFL